MPKQADWTRDMDGNLTLTFSAKVSPDDGHFRLEQNGKRIGHGVAKPAHMAQGLCERMIQAVVMSEEALEKANREDETS